MLNPPEYDFLDEPLTEYQPGITDLLFPAGTMIIGFLIGLLVGGLAI